MSDHRSNFPLQPFVQSFFADLTKTFPGRYLCLADSGQPFCIVVKHPQFEVSILLLGIEKTFIPTLSQTLIEHWWGWWDPPFSPLLWLATFITPLSQPSVRSFLIVPNYWLMETIHGTNWLYLSIKEVNLKNKKHMKKALFPIAVCFSLLTVLMPVTYLASLLY